MTNSLKPRIEKLPPFANAVVHEHPIEVFLYETEQEHEKASVAFTDNKIVFILQGYKEVYTPAQKTIFKAGEGFLLKAGHYLMTERFTHHQTYESLSIGFSNTVAAKIMDNLRLTSPSSNYDHLFKLCASDRIDAFIASIRSYFAITTPALDWNSLLQVKLQELFWLLSNADGGPCFSSFLQHLSHTSTVTLQTVLESHYKENLSLAELAFLGGFSLSTFKRKFREVFNTTPHRWIQERRLQEAVYLLKLPGKNVSDVCYELGFENLSHFIQSFKSKHGLTPGQFQSELIGT